MSHTKNVLMAVDPKTRLEVGKIGGPAEPFPGERSVVTETYDIETFSRYAIDRVNGGITMTDLERRSVEDLGMVDSSDKYIDLKVPREFVKSGSKLESIDIRDFHHKIEDVNEACEVEVSCQVFPFYIGLKQTVDGTYTGSAYNNIENLCLVKPGISTTRTGSGFFGDDDDECLGNTSQRVPTMYRNLFSDRGYSVNGCGLLGALSPLIGTKHTEKMISPTSSFEDISSAMSEATLAVNAQIFAVSETIDDWRPNSFLGGGSRMAAVNATIASKWKALVDKVNDRSLSPQTTGLPGTDGVRLDQRLIGEIVDGIGESGTYKWAAGGPPIKTSVGNGVRYKYSRNIFGMNRGPVSGTMLYADCPGFVCGRYHTVGTGTITYGSRRLPILAYLIPIVKITVRSTGPNARDVVWYPSRSGTTTEYGPDMSLLWSNDPAEMLSRCVRLIYPSGANTVSLINPVYRYSQMLPERGYVPYITHHTDSDIGVLAGATSAATINEQSATASLYHRGQIGGTNGYDNTRMYIHPAYGMNVFYSMFMKIRGIESRSRVVACDYESHVSKVKRISFPNHDTVRVYFTTNAHSEDAIDLKLIRDTVTSHWTISYNFVRAVDDTTYRG